MEYFASRYRVKSKYSYEVKNEESRKRFQHVHTHTHTHKCRHVSLTGGAQKTFSSNDASMDANWQRNEIRDHVGY